MSDRLQLSPPSVRWWGGAPQSFAEGSPPEFSAALWNWGDGVRETNGAAVPDISAISFCIDPLQTEFAVDGRPSFAGTFKPGMMALIPAGQKPWAVQHGGARKLHLYLSNKLLLDVGTELRTVQHGRAPVWRQAGVLRDIAAATFCEHILTQLTRSGDRSRLGLDIAGMELAAHAVMNWCETFHGSDQQPKALPPYLLKRVIDLMQRDLAQDISLKALSESVELSPAHFCRAIRTATGLPPHRYLLSLRLHRARELLIQTDLPITEVAAEIGYEDPSYFARLFKKILGITPLNYRQARR